MKAKSVSVAVYKVTEDMGMVVPIGHMFIRPIKPKKYPAGTNYGLIRDMVERGYKVTISPANKREKRDLLATYTKLYKD